MRYLNQRQAIDAINRGYVLENPEGFKVCMKKGKQVKTNKRRHGFMRNYVFDHKDTWKVVGRIGFVNRLLNGLYLTFGRRKIYEM